MEQNNQTPLWNRNIVRALLLLATIAALALAAGAPSCYGC